MPQNSEPNSSPQKEPADNKKVVDTGLKRTFIGGGVLLLVLLVFTFAQRAGRIPFFTENLLSLLVLVVIALQTYIYHRQEKVMREGLEETRNLLRQNEWTFKENHKQANAVRTQMQEQSKAMKGQLDAMNQSLAETRKTVTQNERAIQVAEENARIAERALYLSERPHFGIANISMQFEAGKAFSLSITFLNGGKSPAWHFTARPIVSLNNHSPEFPEPGDQGPWTVLHPPGDLHNSFFPAGRRTEVNFLETEFKVTPERFDAVMNEDLRLFVQGKAEWKSTVDYQSWDFCLVYFPRTKRFGDYGSC